MLTPTFVIMKTMVKNTPATKKSKLCPKTYDNGKMMRGKYIFVTKCIFPTKDPTAKRSAVTKNAHGNDLTATEEISWDVKGAPARTAMALRTITPEKIIMIGIKIAHNTPMEVCLYF